MADNNNLKVQKNDGEFFEKGELKSSKAFISVIVTIIIFLLILLGGYFYFNSPDKIVKNAINTLYKDFYKNYDNSLMVDLTKDTCIFDASFKFNTDIVGFEELNNESFNFKMGFDYPKSQVSADISWLEGDNKLLGLIYYFINDQAFMKIGNDERLFLIDNDEELNNFNFDEILKNSEEAINIDDYKYVSDKIKDIFIDSLDMNSFKRDSETIKVNDSEVGASKLTYSLSEKNVKNLVTNMVNKINKDDKLLDKISNIYGEEKENLKTSLENIKDSDFKDLGEINIYTNKITTGLLRLEYSNGENKFGINFDSDKEDFYIKSDGIFIVFDVKEYNNEKALIEFTVEDAGISGTLAINTKHEDNKVTGDISFNFKYFMYNFGLSASYNVEVGASVPTVDTSNAVKVSTLGDDEMGNVFNKMFENIQNSKLMKMFMNEDENQDI